MRGDDLGDVEVPARARHEQGNQGQRDQCKACNKLRVAENSRYGTTDMSAPHEALEVLESYGDTRQNDGTKLSHEWYVRNLWGDHERQRNRQ